MRCVALLATLPGVRRALPNLLWPLAGMLGILLVVLWIEGQDHGNVLAHSPYDSYTLQALTWRDGHIPLAHNYPWLELAVYDGKYWVSFPPLPAVPMLILSFFFGENTPSGAAALAYFFGALWALYALLRRYLPADQSTLWLVFIALGGTFVSLVVPGAAATGGVWFQAQLLGLMVTALAFLLVDGKNKVGWGIGLACIALAVACRPFNIIYMPVLLWMLLGHLGHAKRALLPYLAAPVAIGAVIGAYNFARFGNPMEFGHAYLPELKQSGEPMFMPSRIPEHIGNIFRAPSVHDGKLIFPQGAGFAVYLTNPMLLIGLAFILARAIRRKADAIDLILAITIVIHALMLLSHHYNGGIQYGTRYLCDVIPAAVYAVARGGPRIRSGAALAMGMVIAFNIYATVLYEASV